MVSALFGVSIKTAQQQLAAVRQARGIDNRKIVTIAEFCMHYKLIEKEVVYRIETYNVRRKI